MIGFLSDQARIIGRPEGAEDVFGNAKRIPENDRKLRGRLEIDGGAESTLDEQRVTRTGTWTTLPGHGLDETSVLEIGGVRWRVTAPAEPIRGRVRIRAYRFPVATIEGA